MEVVIPKNLEAFVRHKVEEGRYTTEAEVVADALRLMQTRKEVAAGQRGRIRDALDRAGTQNASSTTRMSCGHDVDPAASPNRVASVSPARTQASGQRSSS